LVPVSLSIGNAGNGQILSRAADRPASFGDPNRLATCSSSRVVVSLKECNIASLDGVVLSILEVRICVHTDEIRSSDDSVVGTVNPSSPRINMTDGSPAQWSVGNSRTNLTNVIGNNVWTSTNAIIARNTGRRYTVQVLTAN